MTSPKGPQNYETGYYAEKFPEFIPYLKIADHYLAEVAALWCAYYTKRDGLSAAKSKKLLAMLTAAYIDMNPIGCNVVGVEEFDGKTIVGVIKEAIRVEVEEECASHYARSGVLREMKMTTDDQDVSDEGLTISGKASKLMEAIAKASALYHKSGKLPFKESRK